MEEKKNVKVFIDGSVYTLAGYENTEYMHKVASIIDKKIKEIKENPSCQILNPSQLSILTSINMADEYLKMCARYEILEQKFSSLESEKQKLLAEISDLKNEKANAASEIEGLKLKNKEYETLLDEVSKPRQMKSK